MEEFKIPCLSLKMSSPMDFASDFVTNVGPHAGLEAMAISALLESLRWTSFLLVYQHDSDLVDLAPIIHDRRSSHYYRGTHAAVRMRRLPNNTNEYQTYLKYVRNYLQETNIVIHSNNITTLYSLLQSAKVLNMTEPPFSYLFTSTARTLTSFYPCWNQLFDLTLLEDFLSNVYGTFHCNISGLQLVKNDQMMTTTLALSSEAVWIAGKALHNMKEVYFLFVSLFSNVLLTSIRSFVCQIQL
uniref:ANF_receptor domain-containing protein n=1 Tax=Angiostrongylus cantonensis TaxID=6313 RepID=A0A0K0DQL7_ANGCA